MNVCQMNSKFRAGMNVTMRPGTALYTQMNDLHYELRSVYEPLANSRLHPADTFSGTLIIIIIILNFKFVYVNIHTCSCGLSDCLPIH
jgi:hypothetical protein